VAQGWTIDEAVETLDPPIRRRTLVSLMRGVAPVGTVYGRRGRRPKLYPVAAFARVHGEYVRRRAAAGC
jgi:hypothetical protein